MDSFELNKILGAILGTCLFVLVTSFAANAVCFGRVLVLFEPTSPGSLNGWIDGRRKNDSDAATVAAGKRLGMVSMWGIDKEPSLMLGMDILVQFSRVEMDFGQSRVGFSLANA